MVTRIVTKSATIAVALGKAALGRAAWTAQREVHTRPFVDDYSSFGYWVRRRRRALDLTQAELGGRVGASAAMIRKIEADERRPSRELAAALAAALAVPDGERVAFLRAARDVAVTALPLSASPVTPPAGSPPPHNLPASMTSMVNRVNDLAAVAALLLREDVRLVTLLGPPGMGKTRLSIQVAAQLAPRFGDGVWFVDLSTLVDARLMLPQIAMPLGLAPLPDPPAVSLRRALRARRLLLVLDNLEQIVDEAAIEVAALLRECPGLKVLATSRVRLDVYGEHEYDLPPMSLPPASGEPGAALLRYESVQLFVDRARQHRPDFALTAATAEAVVEICRRMEGVPLALELAAARTRHLPAAELAAALREASGRDWHALLHSTARDLPPRQQTLFNAIAWSDSLLAPDEQSVFRRLGVFVGDFDAPAAAVVGLGTDEVDPGAVALLMERLVDHNLVSRVSRRPDRWRLLEMVRAFAVAELGPDERPATEQRLARHYAARQSDWITHWLDPVYLTAIEPDLDNYRAALRYALDAGDASLAYHLSAIMGRYWERHGLLYEGRSSLAKVLALPGVVDAKLRFAILHEATILAWMQQDFPAAESLAAESMMLARDESLPAAVAVVLNVLGRIYLEQARYEEADRVLLEAIAIGRSLSSPAGQIGMQIVQRGEVALARGDLDQAEALTLAGLAMVTAAEVVPYCLGWNNLAEVALARGNVDGAAEALRRVLPVADLHFRRLRIFLGAVAGLILTDRQSTPDDLARAVALLSFVSATNARLGDWLSPMTQAQLETRIATARQRLSPGVWTRAWDEGQRWTAERTLAEARQTLTARP